MELKQHLIHRKYKKCEAKNQITIGDDFSVPDGKPDIAAILQKRAKMEIEEVHTEKGKIKIRGVLKLWVLYLADRSSQSMASLSTEFPFDEILYMEGASNGDSLKIDWNIEDLKVTVIHPGKLGVRALVTLHGNIHATESHLVAEAIEDQSNVYMKTDTFQAAEPIFERKDSYRIRDEVSLPANKPNVSNILWKDLQLRNMDIRMQEGRLAMKGEVLMLVVYQGEEDAGAIQWMEQAVPFQGTLDVTGLTQEMFGLIEHEISHQDIEVKPDYDGEMRTFQLEMLIDIHMHIYEERTCSVLKDAYSTKEQLNLQSESITYENLRMCNQAKCRISAQEQLEDDLKILQILGHQAQLQNKRCKITDQGILCEGTMEIQILYVTANDHRPFGSANASVPYSQLIEIPEMQKEDTWKVAESLEQIFITMPDSNRIEVRSAINFNACVMQQCRLDNVTGITTEDYDLEEYKKRPGMVIHFVQPRETLWIISKANRTTIEDVKKLNDLTIDEVTPGQKLLLMKSTSENILS